jgi:hypothetical protein
MMADCGVCDDVMINHQRGGVGSSQQSHHRAKFVDQKYSLENNNNNKNNVCDGVYVLLT